MILLLDIGNTRVKGGELREGELLISSKTLSVENLQLGLDKLFDGIEVPTKVLISNVAGNKAKKEIEGWVKKSWDLTPKFIVAESEACGVRNAYPKPEQLGVDRWLAMLGAYNKGAGLKGDFTVCDSPLCIVDCGSAVTFDVVAVDGEHLGGLIIPGLSMMREVLSEKIQIQTDNQRKSKISPLAGNTQDAISDGTMYTLVAAIDRITGDIEKELGASVTRVITGGDAEKLLPLLSGEYIFKLNLVLEGLALMTAGVELT